MADLVSGKVGGITVEVKPTVTLESAVACVMMLNVFLEDNDGYRLELQNDGERVRWGLTDKPPMRTGEIRQVEKRAATRPDVAQIKQQSTLEIAMRNSETGRYRGLAGLEDE